MFNRILVTTDGSPLASLALPAAADLARRLGAGLTVLYVVPDPNVYLVPTEGFLPDDLYGDLSRELHEAGRRVLDEARAQLGLPNVQGRLVEAQRRDVARAIVEEAEALGAELIVMGTHGRGGLGHLLLGSVAERVVHGAGIPVLLVKTPKPKPGGVQEQRERDLPQEALSQRRGLGTAR